MNITVEAAHEALATVQDPEIKKDLITLDLISNLEVVDGKLVKFTLNFAAPNKPYNSQITNEAKKALINAGAIQVEINAVEPRPTAGQFLNKKLPVKGVKNIIAISSGKGGVGKSTVSVNLAIALSQEGHKVGILDADITAPNIPLMLGISGQPDLSEDGKKMKPSLSHGIYAISMGMIVSDNEAVTWRGPMLHKAIGQFFHDVEWPELDYLIVDLPPGTSDAQITISQTVPLAGAIIVSTPQDVAILDSKKGLMMFEQMEVNILGLIENMSYFIAPDTEIEYDLFGRGGVSEFAKEAEQDCLGEIPMEIKTRIGGDTGQPITISDPESHSAKAFREIGQRIAAKLSTQTQTAASI